MREQGAIARTWRGKAGSVKAWPVMLRCGLEGQGPAGKVRLGVAVSGAVRLGVTWCVRRGWLRQGSIGQGMTGSVKARQVRHGQAVHGAVRWCEAVRGMVRWVRVWPGLARHVYTRSGPAG